MWSCKGQPVPRPAPDSRCQLPLRARRRCRRFTGRDGQGSLWCAGAGSWKATTVDLGCGQYSVRTLTHRTPEWWREPVGCPRCVQQSGTCARRGYAVLTHSTVIGTSAAQQLPCLCQGPC